MAMKFGNKDFLIKMKSFLLHLYVEMFQSVSDCWCLINIYGESSFVYFTCALGSRKKIGYNTYATLLRR